MQKVLVQVAYQRIYFTRFENFIPQPIFPNDAAVESVQQNSSVIALSGIGNPKPFNESLKKWYEVVEEIEYDDHHVYRVRDLKSIEAKLAENPDAYVITTEKDAVKLRSSQKIPLEIRQRLYYLPINISFIEDSATDFLQKLEKNVRENQEHSILH